MRSLLREHGGNVLPSALCGGCIPLERQSACPVLTCLPIDLTSKWKCCSFIKYLHKVAFNIHCLNYCTAFRGLSIIFTIDLGSIIYKFPHNLKARRLLYSTFSHRSSLHLPLPCPVPWEYKFCKSHGPDSSTHCHLIGWKEKLCEMFVPCSSLLCSVHDHCPTSQQVQVLWEWGLPFPGPLALSGLWGYIHFLSSRLQSKDSLLVLVPKYPRIFRSPWSCPHLYRLSDH